MRIGAKHSGFACVLGLCLMTGCSETEARTEVMMLVDAEALVRSVTISLGVTVYGGPRGQEQLPSEGPQEYTFAQGARSDAWPRKIALAPQGGDPSRLYRIDVRAFPKANGQGPTIAEVRAISGYVKGRTLSLSLVLQDSCINVSCTNPAQTCRGGTCQTAIVDPMALPDYQEDGGTGRLEGGTRDGGDPRCIGIDCDDGNKCNGTERCENGFCLPGERVTCNDDVACTADSCNQATGECVFEPHDERCMLSAGGTCNPASGCQYPSCDGNTCKPDNGCQNAQCNGNTCDRTSRCGPLEECCADQCVRRGCNDDNSCTDDMCQPSGCVHTPNSASCNDMLFCNGSDRCANTTCSSHSGNPCTGGSTCDEQTDTCIGADPCASQPCDDKVDCTKNLCSITSGCSFPIDPLFCPPGTHCDPSSGPGSGCVDPCAGIICDDRIACTRDTCMNGSCSYMIDDSLCTGGKGEFCDPQRGCVGGVTGDAGIDGGPPIIDSGGPEPQWDGMVMSL